MTVCIYCPNPANSLEHPLPAAFGEFEGAPLLKDRICKTCNGRLGLLDEQLSRCGPEGFFRKFYGVQGRDTHDEINPFYRGSAGGKRLDVRARDPELGFEISFELVNGSWRQLRQIVFVEPSGKSHIIPIRKGTTPEQLVDAYRGLGVTTPSDVRVFCDPEESIWVEPLIKAAWPSVTLGSGQVSSTTYREAEVGFLLTPRYFQAIAKIAFHYFLTQFPEYRGDEPIFSKLREFILETGSNVKRANEFIGKRQTPLLLEMLDPQARPNGWHGHLLCAEIQPNACLAQVLMFLSEDCPPQTYTIRLGNDSSQTQRRAAGHSYIYFPDGPKGKFSGEACVLGTAPIYSPSLPLMPVID